MSVCQRNCELWQCVGGSSTGHSSHVPLVLSFRLCFAASFFQKYFPSLMVWNAKVAQVAVETLILTSVDSLLVKISIFKIALIFQSVVSYLYEDFSFAVFEQFSRHCRNLILSKGFMHLGIKLKTNYRRWPLYLFTFDFLKGYMLVTQCIFITRWTPMDFLQVDAIP